MPVTNETAIEEFEARLTEQFTTNAIQFDPTIIIAIIVAIIPLLQQCFQRNASALRRRPLNRIRVAAAIRRETGASWRDSQVLAERVFDVADNSTDAEINAFVAACTE